MEQARPEDAPAKGKAEKVPAILDYVDYRLFLKDRLEHLALLDRKYSQRWVARRAGFKSPQLLSMIIQGHRNLTREKAVDLARALKLDEREAEYFLLILELAECTSREARAALLEKIQTVFRDGLFAAIPDDGIEIFRDWYYPAVREIVATEGARPDPSWIAARLGIADAEAAAAIETLVAKGYLKREDDGRLVRAQPSVRTARNKIYPIMLASYHVKVLNRAVAGIGLPRDRRHFEGLTFAIPRRLMPQVKDAIGRFFREVDAMVEGQSGREEVCQLHVELFPLTSWQDVSTDDKGD